MKDFLDCLGLGFIMDDEDTLAGVIYDVANNANLLFYGYSGILYLNHEYGNVQLVDPAVIHQDRDQLELIGFDVHANGNTGWTFRITGVGDLNPEDYNDSQRRVMITRPDSTGGAAIIDLINADVLPSWSSDEIITAQMVGFPTNINYYENGEAFEETLSPDEYGRTWGIGDGTVMALSFLKNHTPENPEGTKNVFSDGSMLIRGTVKSVKPGYFDIKGKRYTIFRRVTIGTEFGDLEILHTDEQIAEKQRDLIKEGSTVVGYFYLHGDVAINEYQNGIVKDEEHNLRLLRCVLNRDCKAERLKAVLTDSSTYLSEHSNYTTFTGSDDIISRFHYVANDNPDTKYYAYMATITDIDEGDEELPYQPGKRCVVLATNEPQKYESVAFIDLDEENNIQHLIISKESRYHFKIDEVPVPEIFRDLKPAESVSVALTTRAIFFHYLPQDFEWEGYTGRRTNIASFNQNIELMLDSFRDFDDIPEELRIKNLFGYLFAKAIESEWAVSHKAEKALFSHIVRYAPSDAYHGLYKSDLKDEELNKKLQLAMRTGRSFYKDYRFHTENTADERVKMTILKEALATLQQIGEIYAREHISQKESENSTKYEIKESTFTHTFDIH